MIFKELPLAGAWTIDPVVHGDARGYFVETWREDEFARHIGRVEWRQTNESLSDVGVVRGLHFQRGDKVQAKLVRVSTGRIIDVIVDLRKGSPTFGRHAKVELSGDNHRMLFIPRGFAHGFAVVEGPARFHYMTDNLYAPEAEATLLFDDPALGIDWPVAPADRKLSAKDLKGQPLADLGL